jgi:hypothetical protein
MAVRDLLATAAAAPADSATRILSAAAAFNALTESDLVLVGGAAQVTHTGIGRLTDIDLVGPISREDEHRLRTAGFAKEGRHWVYEEAGAVIAIEVPAAELIGIEPTERVVVGDLPISIIAVTDLMMDRLTQATDGIGVTRDEAVQLAVAAHDRIDWDAVEGRAANAAHSEAFLWGLPELAAELRRLAEAAAAD